MAKRARFKHQKYGGFKLNLLITFKNYLKVFINLNLIKTLRWLISLINKKRIGNNEHY